MSLIAPPLPRLGLPLVAPRPRIISEFMSTVDRDRWPDAPPGHGRPVMLIPGFLAGDGSLTRMAVWLRTGGWTLTRSGITWNVDCMERVVTSVEERLERAVDASGQRALLVGQSRGGAIARSVAALRPDLVRTVVTLGSPLLDQLAVHPQTWPSIIGVATLGTVGVPGLFSFSCFAGHCCARSVGALRGPFPDGVPFVSIYSRSDEVVRWRSCLDPAATQVEVDSSHIGMGMSRAVWQIVAREISALPTA